MSRLPFIYMNEIFDRREHLPWNVVSKGMNENASSLRKISEGTRLTRPIRSLDSKVQFVLSDIEALLLSRVANDSYSNVKRASYDMTDDVRIELERRGFEIKDTIIHGRVDAWDISWGYCDCDTDDFFELNGFQTAKDARKLSCNTYHETFIRDLMAAAKDSAVDGNSSVLIRSPEYVKFATKFIEKKGLKIIDKRLELRTDKYQKEHKIPVWEISWKESTDI